MIILTRCYAKIMWHVIFSTDKHRVPHVGSRVRIRVHEFVGYFHFYKLLDCMTFENIKRAGKRQSSSFFIEENPLWKNVNN